MAGENLLMSLDHVAIMAWLMDTWALLNKDGYAALVINAACGIAVFFIIKALFSPDEGDALNDG